MAEAHYVRVGFRDGEGKTFSVTRTRESGADKTPTELVAALCQGAIPDDPLRQLCMRGSRLVPAHQGGQCAIREGARQ